MKRSVFVHISPHVLVLLYSRILVVLGAPDLRSSVPSGSPVYPQQPVTITCTTINSQILAWEGEDYIGGGSQLTFTSNSRLDSTVVSRNGAIAILISISNSNEGLTITSELLINITTHSTVSRVTCRNVDTGQTDSVEFHKTNENATELAFSLVNKTEICPEDRINVTCMGRNTSIIQWSSSNLANRQIHCRMGDPDLQSVTISNTNIDVSTEYSAADANGNTILTCSLSFVARELPVNQQFSLTCLNVDIGVRAAAAITLQLSDQCGTITTYTTERPTFITQTDDELVTAKFSSTIISGSVILRYRAHVISLIALAEIAFYNVA